MARLAGGVWPSARRPALPLLRFDLLAGSPAALAASGASGPPRPRTPGSGPHWSGNLQRGPDGHLYVLRPGSGAVGRIEQANAPS